MGHGSGFPLAHAGGCVGHLPRKSAASITNQKASTIIATGSCSTSRAPTIMPSTPRKRVSRPIRIALSEISTTLSARPRAPGRPRICAKTAVPFWPMSTASSTVRPPARKSETDWLSAIVKTIADSACRMPATIGRYTNSLGISGRRARVATPR